MINLSVDFGPIADYMAVADAHARVLESGRTRSTMAIAMGLTAATAFNAHMDMISPSMKAELGHVYEWGEIGQANGRLWHMALAGAGNTRILNYVWRASNKVVPVGQEAKKLGGETVIGNDTRRPIHVFRWKAPMTENGVPVTISPKNSRVLAFPVGGEMQFSSTSVRPRINSSARGQFSLQWAQFFTATAAAQTQNTEKGEYEAFMKVDFTNKVIRKIKGGKVSPTKVGVFVDVRPEKDIAIKSGTVTKKYFTKKAARAALLAANQIRSGD